MDLFTQELEAAANSLAEGMADAWAAIENGLTITATAWARYHRSHFTCSTSTLVQILTRRTGLWRRQVYAKFSVVAQIFLLLCPLFVSLQSFVFINQY